MKFIWLSLIIIICTTLSAQEQYAYLTPFKKGIVEYHVESPSSNYSVKVYISDNGKKQTMNINGKVNNKPAKYRVVFKNGYMYTFSFSKKEIIKVPHIIPNGVIVKNTGLSKQGEEVIKDHLCNIYKYQDNKVWFWKNYLMKMVDKKNNFKFTINSIDDNGSIPDNIFDLPKSYKIKELNFNFGN